VSRRDGLVRRYGGLSRLRQVSARSTRRDAESPTQRIAKVEAMTTASELYASARDTPTLLRNAANSLAARPGAMCLVSLAGSDGLRPFTVAHREPGFARDLEQILAVSREAPPADAFSQTVQRNGGSLRMDVGSTGTLRLWLPPAYWTYLERTRVRRVLAAALVRRGQVRGTLLLWREQDQAEYVAADQAFVSELAGRLAQGIALRNAIAATATAMGGTATRCRRGSRSSDGRTSGRP